MADESIQEGFEVFVSDDGRSELIVYVENAGDFTIPLGAVKAIHSQKVIVDCDQLDRQLRRAIGHAHDAEDPRI